MSALRDSLINASNQISLKLNFLKRLLISWNDSLHKETKRIVRSGVWDFHHPGKDFKSSRGEHEMEVTSIWRHQNLMYLFSERIKAMWL